MTVHTIDKARIISDVQFGDNLNHAVTQGRRSDFALMLALMSGDANESTPLSPLDEKTINDEVLRRQFQLAPPQPLSASNEEDYVRAGAQADAFHRGGIASAHLRFQLAPAAMHYPPQGTHGFDEAVYHNLSGHQRRKLADSESARLSLNPTTLYENLTTAHCQDKMRVSA
ncbi:MULTISPECIES: VC2046/SO_2500 family protein [unclassified Salinivibrio]|uniref:VC2046/SO_2500 family protein n=1 Tax=unclassified Salinivibrio TaxID=2636825 RepID=UPI00084BE2AF|nr:MULTISPECIES: VC2046/SO_2500 family protein [unclassified Salinivibrio]ODP96549.1 hypothetical protein BGK46_14940 [Salinivibrio sp. DV]PCE67697.1 hypothetical protein B6G00_04975 [Salinivibrio sp. YCSC6]QCF35406.1 hypothetical protein E8E00_04000 [Salinivibrio sp. YCSC6]